MTGFVLVDDVIHVDAVSCVVGSLSGAVLDAVLIFAAAAVVMTGVCEIVSVVVMVVLVIVPPALLD